VSGIHLRLATDEEVLVLPEAGLSAGNAFSDNLDHLTALEQEATLMLALGLLRSMPPKDMNSSDNGERFQDCFPSMPAGIDRAQADRLLAKIAAVNRRREAVSGREGVVLNFTALCRQWQFTPFERSVVMFLLMQFTAPAFRESFRKCGFERERKNQFSEEGNNCVEVGTLLSVICRDYREQIESRRHFSLDGTLVRENIIDFYESMGETTNLLGGKVSLHGRIVRTIIGDSNLYRTALSFLRRERCSVSFDQVILPEGLKEEIAACVGGFLDDRAAGRLDALDAFFGYGTGLALLFHGPSGSGKTMLAKALATRFDRQIISFAAESAGKFQSPENILAAVFREAEQQASIVLLDECDDVFVNNSRLSQALLTELEKARCVVILATNKPVDLDPAMDRRITRKVAFPIPAAAERLRIWQALRPAGIELDPDIDLAALADRYQFSGGLIKNCYLLAATQAFRNGSGPIRITRAHLEHAADMQATPSSEEERICRRYAPAVSLAELQLRSRDKVDLQGAALAWQRLKGEGLGLNILISASSVWAGISAAEALARECGIEVRSFNYALVRSSSEADRIVDPVTQRKLLPVDYAFSMNSGASAMTMFVDHAAFFEVMLDHKNKDEQNYYLSELTERMRSHTGLFCMVTWHLAPQPIPVEFHLHFALENPSEDIQIRRWEERLGAGTCAEEDLVALVERWPMHGEEIDFMARQATILSTIRGVSGKPGLAEVREVISRYRRSKKNPVLFGAD